MTKRTEVSTQKNIWFDTQEVDDSDLTLEQDHNESNTAAIVNNHIGTGVIPEVLTQNIVFDSTLHVGLLDGVAILPQNQTSDSNFGNQLEITLKKSNVCGRKKIKVIVIGLDFNSNLQYECFTFKTNEIQVGKKHFIKILVLLFNDFIGNPNLSLNLGGEITIKESKPMQLSRDCAVLAQDIQPNLTFRDFFVDGPLTLQGLLQNALPTYNVDTLGIYTNEQSVKSLSYGDVITNYGQKFLATVNNIQKITVLMSVVNNNSPTPDDLVWNGDLVLTVYKLQTDITNPLDIVPNLAIEFPPDPVPVAQLSVDYISLKNNGIVLDSNLQPVDFIFSNSPIAGGNVIEVGQYYAFTLKRSGAANKCDLLIAVGGDRILDSRITVFTGTTWVDIPEEDLWFQIWADSAKVSDGQAYDTGIGIMIDKTIIDQDTQATIDYSFNDLQFVGNDVYKATLSAQTQQSTPIPSEITGNPVFSRQQMVPQVELLNTIALSNITQASDPLLLGAISDKNVKYYDSISSEIKAHLRSASIVKDNILIKIIDDATDTTRFDTDVNELINRLLNGDFVSAKITPNAGTPATFYKIAKAELCSMIIGDVNGDGLVDENDLDLLNQYKGFNLNISPPTNTIIATNDGYTTVVNGYNMLTKPFTNEFSLTFEVVSKENGYIIGGASTGTLIANPNDPSLAQFTSPNFDFNSISSLGDYRLVITNSATDNNDGYFDIISHSELTDVITIQKQYLSLESIQAMFRADIDGDFIISEDDGYLLNEYINNNSDTLSSTSTFPRPATNPYTKIGTSFNVIKLKLEKFEDRYDDYTDTLGSGRPTTIHQSPEIFLSDGYYSNHNFLVNPPKIIIEKKLSWDESLVVSNSNPKFLPTVFTTAAGHHPHECNIDGMNCLIYPQKPEFDKGRVDYFVPDNLIIGDGGTFKNPDGTDYKVDFEIASITLEIPDGMFGTERTINIIQDFIAEYQGKGTTKIGYPAMKFADCSYIQQDALTKDQVRFAVAVQSFSPQINGLSEEGYEGIIIDHKMGVHVDHENGLLTINFTNLYEDEVLPTLSTKIQITVFIKKAGFNNKPKFIDSTKVHNMLNLISVFSGANVGGVSALVDLDDDVSGILAILHGGTGLNHVGSAGTVLTSNGSGLSYQFIQDLSGFVSSSDGPSDAGLIPKLDGYGRIDASMTYKNPLYITAFAGVAEADGYLPQVIGAFTFRFDKYILQGLSSIKLELILENQLPDSTPANNTKAYLFSVSNQTYIPLDGVTTYLETASNSPVLLRSDDIKSQLLEGATDYIYEVQLSLTTEPDIYQDPTDTDQAVCKMARLVIEYDNPTPVLPPTSESVNFFHSPGY